jgi:phosphomannomutase
MRRLNSHDERLDEGPVDGVVLGSEGERVVVVPNVDEPMFRILAEASTKAASERLADDIGAFIEQAARDGSEMVPEDPPASDPS